MSVEEAEKKAKGNLESYSPTVNPPKETAAPRVKSLKNELDIDIGID